MIKIGVTGGCMSVRVRLAVSVLLCLFLAGGDARGADIFYDDSGSEFSDGAAWVGGVAPGSGDNAIFDSGSSLIPINFIQNNTIDSLQLRDSNVSFDVFGFTFALTQSPPQASLLVFDPAGGDAAGSFTSGKTGGVLGVFDVDVLAPITGTSSLTFTGGNLNVIPVAPNTYTIGDTGGAAQMVISSGATVSLNDLTVNKTGTVSVSGDSQLNVSGDILVDAGTLNSLDGDNLSWSSSRTLTVTNGGNIGFTGSAFTTPFGSNLIVTGTGSSVDGAGLAVILANSSQIQVSNGGAWDKSLDITDGSTVTVDGAGSTIARFDVINGSVTLSNGAAANGSIYSVGDSGSPATGTLNINSGSSLTATSTFNVSSSTSDSSGVVNINGGGSALTTNSSAPIGSGTGNTGIVNIDNGGVYNINGTTTVNPTGTIDVVDGDLNVNGTLNIVGGQVSVGDFGDLNADPAGAINITENGLLAFTDLIATINLNDGNVITIDGTNDQAGTPSTLHAYDNLDVEQGTILFATNDGTVMVDDRLGVNTGGSVSIQFDAMLDVAGNIVVNDGDLSGLHSGNFTWAANRLMDISNGGSVTFNSGFAFDSADITIEDAGSQLNGSGVTASLTNFSQVVVTGGGSWTKSVRVDDDSTVLVDGAGSTLGRVDIIDGTVTLTNGAHSSGTLYNIGDNGGNGETATLNILSGSSLESTFNVFVVSNFSTESTGVVNVDGGSSLTVQSADIGSNTGSSGTVNILNGSSYTAEVDTTLHNTGTIHIDGGTALLGDYIDEGGTIDFVSGTFGHNGDIRIGTGSLTGSTINTSTKSLIMGGTVTIDPNAVVNIDGGILSGGAIVRNGTINFTAGRLELTSSAMDVDFGGLLGRTPVIGAGQELAVFNDLDVTGVGQLTIDGGSVYATSLNNSGYVRMNSIGSLLDGDSVNNDGVLTGTGVVNVPLVNNVAGEVRVDAGGELIFTGEGNSNSGLIYNDGGNLRFAGSLTNQSTGVISGRGAMRFPGGLNNDGDLNFSQGESDIYGGIVNNAAGQVSVAGVANTSFFGSLLNNGDVFVGQDSRIVFFGDVSGPGSYSGNGLIEFVGGFSPGASPAAVSFGGDVTLHGLSNLLIELGGTLSGDEFDQLNIGGTVGLGGVLEVALIDGFTPSPGESFRIINAAGVTGVFDSVDLSLLPGGTGLDVVYDSTGVTLVVAGGLEGDLNGDGFVGIADLNIVLGNWNQTIPPGDPLADPSGDNFVGIADLNVVLGNWNAGTPPDGSSAIPEPGTGLVLCSLFYLVCANNRSIMRGKLSC